MKELKREAKKQIEEIKLKQQLEWMIWEAQKPNLDLIIKARKAEEKRKEIEEEGLPEFFQIREELPLMKQQNCSEGIHLTTRQGILSRKQMARYSKIN